MFNLEVYNPTLFVYNPLVKKVLKERELELLEAREVDISGLEKPWDQIENEPSESHAFLLDLINNVKDKTLKGLFNYESENNKLKYSWGEFKELARRFKWVERAWAYDRSLGEQIKARNETALERIQTEMEKFAEQLIKKNAELTGEENPEAVMMKYAGLIASAKNGLPNQVAAVYKSIVGDKMKMEVEGKFDHRVAVAVAQFAKDTL